jgi:hypothetical protein
MADKKLTPEDLRTASGGASKDVRSGPDSDKLSDNLARLRQILNSEADFDRVRYANLSAKDLASVLGAGASAVAAALEAQGISLQRRKAASAPPTADVRGDDADSVI